VTAPDDPIAGLNRWIAAIEALPPVAALVFHCGPDVLDALDRPPAHGGFLGGSLNPQWLHGMPIVVDHMAANPRAWQVIERTADGDVVRYQGEVST